MSTSYWFPFGRARREVRVINQVVLILIIAGGAALCRGQEKTALKDENLQNSSSSVQPPSWMTSPLFHSPKVFAADYNEMRSKFKVYIYPFKKNVTNLMFDYAGADGPFPGGNYASEFFFFRNLYESDYITKDPEEAHLFVLPFSVFKIRMALGPNAVAPYVKYYMEEVIRKEFPYWNRTGGADHFYATCHDLGSMVSENAGDLGQHAIQVVCPSNIWLRTYVPHKDMSYPQIWPHPKAKPGGLAAEKRNILAFWSGSQNSRVRAYVKSIWEEDEEILLGGGKVLREKVRGPDYFENFRSAKFCLHITGYQVHTARIGDAVKFGCVPVIISDQYDLPFNKILNWKELAVVVKESTVPKLKQILKAADHPRLHKNVETVRRHFTWNTKPQDYDLFNMMMYELWLRRFTIRPSFAMY
ncbi:hypothetical protein R1flu_005620 [Riccia fluitans]|uniref:Exostosin GT47 domain-containing protein n=1 Tax=Riccia fluitans TaxID=41844 RepID=A0ABD1YTN8_9MARC